VRRTLEVEHCGAGEISLALLDDVGMRRLHDRFLGEDRTTDVLAFSLGDADDVLGDVYLGLEQAERQATELDIPLEEELMRLAVHGTLHVLGHDHPDGPERDGSPMFELQERIVRALVGETPMR
jgi:probable rRNA maturation factor